MVKKKSQASKADKYLLYEEAVQAPDFDVKLLNRIYKKEFGERAVVFREDFCGTAVMACEWIKASKDNTACGVDLDPVPLNWGKAHHVAKLSEHQLARLTLLEDNVLTAKVKPADAIAALNFSFFIFKERDLLKSYFKKSFQNLKSKGVFLIDAYGGAETLVEQKEKRKLDSGVTYIWEQALVEPTQMNVVNHIHFRFKDGSKMEKAFTYDWRMWGLAELRDLLMEVGFDRVDFYWQGEDADGEPNGVYSKVKKAAPNDPAWVAYLAAIKK